MTISMAHASKLLACSSQTTFTYIRRELIIPRHIGARLYLDLDEIKMLVEFKAAWRIWFSRGSSPIKRWTCMESFRQAQEDFKTKIREHAKPYLEAAQKCAEVAGECDDSSTAS